MNQNLTWFRGDTFNMSCTLMAGSDPVDLTDSDLVMTYKRSYKDPDVDALFQIGTPTEIVIDNDPTTGKFVVTVPSDATLGLQPPNLSGVYDLEAKFGDGTRLTLLNGEITLTLNVTVTL